VSESQDLENVDDENDEVDDSKSDHELVVTGYRRVERGRYSSPLPPPTILKEYQEIGQGVLNHLLDEQRKESEHRRQKEILETNETIKLNDSTRNDKLEVHKGSKREFIMQFTQSTYALCIVGGSLSVFTYLVVNDHAHAWQSFLALAPAVTELATGMVSRVFSSFRKGEKK